MIVLFNTLSEYLLCLWEVTRTSPPSRALQLPPESWRGWGFVHMLQIQTDTGSQVALASGVGRASARCKHGKLHFPLFLPASCYLQLPFTATLFNVNSFLIYYRENGHS